MSRWPRALWNQLKNITVDELIRALEQDGWVLARAKGAQRWYRHPSGRGISVHYHPRKTFSPKLLRWLLEHIEWNESDLKRLKLVR